MLFTLLERVIIFCIFKLLKIMQAIQIPTKKHVTIKKYKPAFRTTF
jgi:hypothetical protein